MSFNAPRLLALSLLALAAACATAPDKGGQQSRGPFASKPVPNPHEKVGKPYQVKGVWYVPKPEPDYDKVGRASWYGPGFHGRLTANGEVFDENRLTAAHPTLPLPSIVEVTNPANGKRLTLRVNDRGPFANDRILDLSKEAARRLGTEAKGVANVRVRYVGPARLDQAIVKVGQAERGQSLAAAMPRPPVLSPLREPQLPTETDIILADLDPSVLDGIKVNPVRNAAFFVQIGAFSTSGNARAAVSRLPEDKPVSLHIKDSGPTQLTLVRMGPFSHPLSAQEALEEAKTQGFGDAHIVEEVAR
ncbi:septal ring lytic transglycosylase RlpA family protein [Parvularcula maris]|uniref:Endolytic peptidoglycan transglycosylase RlpA n=1 Tax=Parvularcula maris TaxID=2965077 RepID=A0A9X2LB53_9PROT|nr:septal ring lytic transglycosylase RlpA family protein [Parvularcula maris]MCQ8186234.1 septal ring lytic transglycosylase RlpA family protein [Parvularcula maris]